MQNSIHSQGLNYMLILKMLIDFPMRELLIKGQSINLSWKLIFVFGLECLTFELVKFYIYKDKNEHYVHRTEECFFFL